jgi:transcriptional antiterminator NusG
MVTKTKKITEDKDSLPTVPADQPDTEEFQTAPNHIVFNKPTPRQEEKARWFVVHTYSGHEIKVAKTLHQRIGSMGLEDYVFEVLIPTQNKIKISKGKRYETAEKIFPGYMLIKMILTDNSWLTVRTTPGITSFVGIGNKPTPLPAKEVEAIQKFMTMAAPKFKATFSVGEAVKIVEGPFADFLGTVDHIDDEKGKVRVLVSIFGRETPVELDFLQVAKI